LTSPQTTQKKKYDNETVEENTCGETMKLTKKGGSMGATSIATFTPGKPRHDDTVEEIVDDETVDEDNTCGETMNLTKGRLPPASRHH